MTKEEIQAAREAEWQRLILMVDNKEITISEANRRFTAWADQVGAR